MSPLIPFNRPFYCGKELDYIREAASIGEFSGDGTFTKKCSAFFESRYGFKKVLLTTSCTDALELAALLCDIKPGDEVIIPSYTFVSSANPFVLRGASIVFADSAMDSPNLDVARIEPLITPKTKAIVPVHYAGVACDMDALMALAEKYNLFVIEDAAQSIDAFYKQRPLGSIGHLGAFSFHDTKNINSGEGGMLAINDDRFLKRAEIIREKGTNRSAFFRGEVAKYHWVDIGSSFLPSEITAAFLYAQLEHLDRVQEKRLSLWNTYYDLLEPLQDDAQFTLPLIPDFATHNAHVFYLVLKNEFERSRFVSHLKEHGVQAVSHYQSLHNSPFYSEKHSGMQLPQAIRYSDSLLRLPLYYDLTIPQVEQIVGVVAELTSPTKHIHPVL